MGKGEFLTFLYDFLFYAFFCYVFLHLHCESVQMPTLVAKISFFCFFFVYLFVLKFLSYGCKCGYINLGLSHWFSCMSKFVFVMFLLLVFLNCGRTLALFLHHIIKFNSSSYP